MAEGFLALKRGRGIQSSGDKWGSGVKLDICNQHYLDRAEVRVLLPSEPSSVVVLCRALDGPTIRLSNGLSRNKSLHPSHRLAQLPTTHSRDTRTLTMGGHEERSKAQKTEAHGWWRCYPILCAGSRNWTLNIATHGRSQGMTSVGSDSTLPQWRPSVCLFRGVSQALGDEGPHADPPPWKQLCLV